MTIFCFCIHNKSKGSTTYSQLSNIDLDKPNPFKLASTASTACIFLYFVTFYPFPLTEPFRYITLFCRTLLMFQCRCNLYPMQCSRFKQTPYQGVYIYTLKL